MLCTGRGCGEPVWSLLQPSTGLKELHRNQHYRPFRRGLLGCEAGQVIDMAKPGAESQAMLHLGDDAWGLRDGFGGGGTEVAQSFSL